MNARTCDIFDENKMEDILQIYVKFTNDHAGDVGQEKHDGETEDADDVCLFLLPRLIWHWSCLKNQVSNTEEDMKKEDTERSNDCGDDDSEDDGGEAKRVVNVMADIARKIHLFAQDMIRQDWINKREDPDQAKCNLVKHFQTGNKFLFMFFIFLKLLRQTGQSSISISNILIFAAKLNRSTDGWQCWWTWRRHNMKLESLESWDDSQPR